MDEDYIRYHKPLTMVMKNLHGGRLVLKPAAYKLLTRIIDKFLWKLLFVFKGLGFKNDLPSMDLMQAAQRSAEEVFCMGGEQLWWCAISHCEKTLMMYKTGIIDFDPMKALAVKPVKKSVTTSRSNRLEYVPCVEEVFKVVCPENSVNVGVVKAVAFIARELVMRMVNESVLIADGGDVKPQHVKLAVDSMMMTTMATQANSEAFRFLCMFQEGFIGAKLQLPVKVYNALKSSSHHKDKKTPRKSDAESSKS